MSLNPLIAQVKAYGYLIIVLLVITVAGLIWYQHTRIEKLEAKNAIAEADVAAADTYIKGSQTVQAAKTEANHETQEALDRYPQYRDGVVPSDVADRLRN